MNEDLQSFGLFEQSGSGTLTGNGSEEYIFKGMRGAASGAWESLVSAANSNAPWRGKYIQLSSCKLSSDAAFDTLFIVTAKTPGGQTQPEKDDGENQCSLSISYMEKQLETHPGYLTKWKYDLYYAVEATDEALTNPQFEPLPVWYDSAKTCHIPAGDQKRFRWGQSTPPDQTITEGGKQKTYRWLLFISREKPGQEIYPIAAPTVTERLYFRTLAQANNNLRRANTHHAPSETYIYSKDAAHWIVQPQGIEEIKGYFVSVNLYTYADKWDADIFTE